MTHVELDMVRAVGRAVGRGAFSWSDSFQLKAHSLTLQERVHLYRAVLRIDCDSALKEAARQKLAKALVKWRD